jgi:RHS repeat-associated protein
MSGLAQASCRLTRVRDANFRSAFGRPRNRTKYVYDSYGFLNETKDNAAGTVFWQLNTANDANFPTLETLGNTVQVATSYTPWTNEVLTRTEGSGGSTTNLQNLSYNWDLAGNLHNRIDNRQGLTEQFAYDSMNRLLSSTLNGTNNLTMTYDAAGNIASKSDVSSSAYVYDSAHPHAVKTAGSWSMTYDNDGNMITRAGGSISWYSYNLPNTINYSGNSTQFFYNASHQRWKQVASYSGTTETTHYIGGMLEIMTRGSNPTEYRHQIPAGSGMAVYTRRTDGSTSTYYATSDHLGSSDLVMDSSANVLTRESFTPFGARRGSAWTGAPSSGDYTAFGNTTRKGFTGHEMLDSVALVHMNGRVYDPFLGRFLSADSVIQSLGATESINPYAYAWNDPLKYVDPNGHSLASWLQGVITAVVSVVVFAVMLYLGAPLWAAFFGAGFAGGFTGALLATGSLSAALSAGLIGGAIGLIAYESPLGSGIAKAIVGCAIGGGASGNCGRMAVADILSAEIPIPNGGGGATGVWGNALATVEAGVIGGIESRIAGGNFANGFSSAAATYLATDIAGQIRNQASSGPTGGSASGEPSSDLPTVVVTGSRISWPASLLSGFSSFDLLGRHYEVGAATCAAGNCSASLQVQAEEPDLFFRYVIRPWAGWTTGPAEGWTNGQILMSMGAAPAVAGLPLLPELAGAAGSAIMESNALRVAAMTLMRVSPEAIVDEAEMAGVEDAAIVQPGNAGAFDVFIERMESVWDYSFDFW